jgi:serine protease Do
MNTAVASGGQNIGFALPAKVLRSVLQNYQKNGRIVRAYLGVRYIQINADVQQKNHLSYDYGVLVQQGDSTELAVLPGSPADKAGIQGNDIILEADGQKLTQDVSLQQIIANKTPGDSVSLKISRKGAEKNLTVKLEEMKS